ncbi:MAG: hypothetical protein A4E65_00758 [Syntrophorhabdus sp. PtaU1.Bin153]|nr:MAG: hypothetical protein A4E65_00758 [Syntrophorhabdus sp. PtaU1.Bin153]
MIVRFYNLQKLLSPIRIILILYFDKPELAINFTYLIFFGEMLSMEFSPIRTITAFTVPARIILPSHAIHFESNNQESPDCYNRFVNLK